MTAKDLLLFLNTLSNMELNKRIKLESKLGVSEFLLDIDDADPAYVYLQSYVAPASEN